jgi:hypothetical protein
MMERFSRKLVLIVLAVVVIIVAAFILYNHDHKTVAVTTLKDSVQTGSSPILPGGPVSLPAADSLVQSFYTAFISSNQPESVIKQYGTAQLLSAYTNYYVHNSSSVSSQNYADGSIVCGNVKPKSITGVGALTSGAASAQIQVVEVEPKDSAKVSPTATLTAEVIHQGSSLKINSIDCQELVGTDSHKAT